MNAATVGKPSLISHPLRNIDALTLERNLMSVINVENPSAQALILLCTRECTLERKPMNVKNVGRPLGIPLACGYM